jgi:flagellin-like protein
LSTQSFYIGGIEDAEKAASSAFGAVILFVITFVASVAGIWYDSMYKAEPIKNNGNGNDNMGHHPEADYQLSQDVPASYGTST